MSQRFDEDDEDGRYTRSESARDRPSWDSRYRDDDGPGDPARGERELTLSTASIAFIFFAIVLLCGVCFGFGYSLGHRRPPTPALAPAADTPPPAPAAVETFNNFKPPAGSPANAPPTRPTPAATPLSAPNKPVPQPSPQPAPIVRVPPAEHTQPAPPAPSPGSFVVQVAAISSARPDDADLLANGLRARGYAVTTHPEADHLIHVQVGPFTTRKDAEAMAHRLQADGYQPYIK